jgi:Mn-dependent DtxR family transcriptional regulator
MGQLSEIQLRYLSAIYNLAQTMLDVGVADIAKAMGISKATASKMVGNLMNDGLVVREAYGKVYLTDVGFLAAKRLQQKMGLLVTLIPKMGLALDDEELRSVAYTLAVSLPEHALDHDNENWGRQQKS